jgi:phage tail tape-measure protein
MPVPRTRTATAAPTATQTNDSLLAPLPPPSSPAEFSTADEEVDDGCAIGDVDGCLVGDAVGCLVGDAVGCAVGDAVGCSVGDAVGEAVGDAVGGLVGNTVGCAVGDAVGCSVGDAVGEAVGASVGGTVGPTVGANVGSAVGAALGERVGGSVGKGAHRRWKKKPLGRPLPVQSVLSEPQLHTPTAKNPGAHHADDASFLLMEMIPCGVVVPRETEPPQFVVHADGTAYPAVTRVHSTRVYRFQQFGPTPDAHSPVTTYPGGHMLT